jgi:hypothetical protein
MLTKLLLETLKEKKLSENVGVHGKIILKWILKKYDMKVWIELKWLRIGRSSRLL